MAGRVPALGGSEKGRVEAASLFGNLNTKVFHCSGDPVTNEWASGLIGRTRQAFANASNSHTAEDQMAAMFGMPGSGGGNRAVEAVRSVLGGSIAGARCGPGSPQRVAKPPVRAVKKTGKRRGRAPADLSSITEPIVSMLRATPGQRAEDLGQALGMKAKDLKRPIDRLLSDGAIRKEGKARATRYYVA